MKRDFKGVWIPKHIWLNADLSAIEKILLAEIDSLDNDPGRGCFASNEYFGKFIGVSEGRAANIISDLKKRGFLEQVFWDGRNRGLRLCESRLHENVKADLTETLTLHSRKREHINTDINTVEDISSTIPAAENFSNVNTAFLPNPPIPAAPPSQFDKWLIDLESRCREPFTMSRKIPAAKFDEYLRVFRIEASGKSEAYNRWRDIYDHFLNWSASQYRMESEKPKGQSRQPQPQQPNRTNIMRWDNDRPALKEKQAF